MNLVKYAYSRGLMNRFYTEGVLRADVPKKEEAKMVSRQIEFK